MGSVDCRPITLFAQPHSKTATMTPYAAPIDKMLSMAALVAITTERNAVVSKMNEIATTAMISHASLLRSEERRVGKECRSGGSPYHEKKKGSGDWTVDTTMWEINEDEVGIRLLRRD